ncbi:MAG: Gfo/Idh/MocA family oxidoreductase, partial [Lachnospiraceae bacterium]|nr:Gfo/Idh/MocA family oxidoreductase [Lachnospiraceae bacterium]
MKRKIRVAQYGVGRMGKMHIKYAIMKGAELVAALDCNPDQIGMDAGELAGIGSIGIPISDSNNTTAILTETKPDIVIMATRSFLSDCKDSILECVACGVNVITICEEALWPFATSSEAATEIDEVAKKYGVSVCGTGFADVFWGNLPAMIFGSAARITKIHGSCIVNLEDYGDVLAERHGVGLTLDEYKKRFGEGKSTKNGAELKDTCFLGDQNGWICKYLGLTIQNQSLIDYPLTSSRELFCTPMNLKVPAGYVIGSSTVYSTETTEGIT